MRPRPGRLLNAECRTWCKRAPPADFAKGIVSTKPSPSIERALLPKYSARVRVTVPLTFSFVRIWRRVNERARLAIKRAAIIRRCTRSRPSSRITTSRYGHFRISQVPPLSATCATREVRARRVGPRDFKDSAGKFSRHAEKKKLAGLTQMSGEM